MFRFSIGPYAFAWNYQHTVNILRDGVEIDVFSLNYGRDDWMEQEVLIAAYEWVKETEQMEYAWAHLEED